MKTVKGLTLHDLKKINKNSIKEGYNRNIYFSKFKMKLKEEMQKDTTKFGHWNDMDTMVCIQPIMIHEHKSGVKTAPHMRCFIRTTFESVNDLIIDITMKDFRNIKNYDVETAEVVSEVA